MANNAHTSVQFSSICPSINVRVGINHLSSRDKVELFRFLLEDLGIANRLHDEPDATARAQEIITEQWTKHWDAK
jgi:hypothetical protein